jgi:hypothetical protein
MEYRGPIPESSASQKVIRPGETLEVRTMEVTFPLSLRDNTTRAGELSFGTHFVELEFEVWDVRTHDSVTSESQPILVKVEKMSALRPCK